jgi:hypothetical protein
MRPHELRAARKALGLTQVQLQDWLGYRSDKAKQVGSWEAGRAKVPGAVARAVTLLIAARRCSALADAPGPRKAWGATFDEIRATLTAAIGEIDA